MFHVSEKQNVFIKYQHIQAEMSNNISFVVNRELFSLVFCRSARFVTSIHRQLMSPKTRVHDLDRNSNVRRTFRCLFRPACDQCSLSSISPGEQIIRKEHLILGQSTRKPKKWQLTFNSNTKASRRTTCRVVSSENSNSSEPLSPWSYWGSHPLSLLSLSFIDHLPTCLSFRSALECRIPRRYFVLLNGRHNCAKATGSECGTSLVAFFYQKIKPLALNGDFPVQTNAQLDDQKALNVDGWSFFSKQMQ